MGYKSDGVVRRMVGKHGHNKIMLCVYIIFMGGNEKHGCIEKKKKNVSRTTN